MSKLTAYTLLILLLAGCSLSRPAKPALDAYLVGTGLTPTPLSSAALTPATVPAAARFEQFDVSAWFPSLKVNCLFQDRQGLLWLCSTDGLYRYDGYDMRRFPLPYEGGREPGELRSIYEDHQGIFWVAADDGLDRLNPRSGQWALYRNQAADARSLTEGPVVGAAEDDQQRLWVAAGESLDLLDRNTNQFTRYHLSSGGPPGGQTITAMLVDRHGRVWAGTQEPALYRLDPATGQVQRRDLNQPPTAPPSASEIRAMLEDADGQLWLAVNGGLLHLTDEQEFTWLPHGGSRGSDDRPTGLARGQDGSFWIATQADGLYRFEPQTRAWGHYTFDAVDPYSLSEANIASILVDRSNIVWAVTRSGKVDRFDPRHGFRIFQHLQGNSNSLSGNAISAVAEDAAGRLWIGTHGYGLNLYDRSTGQWTHFRMDRRGTGGLNDDLVTAVAAGPKGEIWVGTQFGGLNRFDPASQRWEAFQNGLDENSLHDNAIQTLLVGLDGMVYIGTQSGSLERLDPLSGKITHHRPPPRPADPNPLSASISALASDKSGELWVGTIGGALYHFSPVRGQWSQDRLEGLWPDGPQPVVALYVDQDGAVWVGTQGNGLARLAPSGDRLQQYPLAPDSPVEDIVSIQADRQGALWLGTGSGMWRLILASGTAQRFGSTDGLPGESFSPRATLRSRTGEMVFGSQNGLVVFDPAGVDKNQVSPLVVITDFQLFYRSIDPQRIESRPDGTAQVRLNYWENVFSFNFSALDYADPAHNQYAYRLEGLDPDWVRAGNRHQAAYTHLAPGEYVFRVKGANGDGAWNEQGTAWRLVIQPPFWQTAPFWGIVAALALGLVAGGVRLRLQTLERQKRRLEEQVQTRTRELNDALVALDRSRAAAEHAAVMEERQRLARELHDSVTQLIYGQAISADVSRKLLRQGDLPALDHRLEELGTIALQSLKEMRLLLYELRPSFFEEEGIVQALELRLDSVERRSQIKAHLETEGDLEAVPADASWEIYRIAIEALNNTLKHAAATEVWVLLQATKDSTALQVQLKVCDNGAGFDLGAVTGGGVGLRSMQERAAKIGGRLDIQSVPGEGTQVQVVLRLEGKSQT